MSNKNYITLFRKNCKFTFGITNINDLPVFNLPEIAFWGRSNVGKSSLINALLGTKKLVKVSSTPGKTSQINFFNLNQQLIIADLPGYGFAKVSKSTKYHWNKLVYSYVSNRTFLKRIFLLIDAKVAIKPIDTEAMELLDYIGKSYIIVVTKIDNILKEKIDPLKEKVINKIKKNLASYPEVFITSAKTKYGINELQNNIANTIL